MRGIFHDELQHARPLHGVPPAANVELAEEIAQVPLDRCRPDVQCPRGWLLQGVFTWPEHRRRGLAAAGVSELCRRAFASGGAHVQLAVIEGNEAAERLYEGLGFQRFARLRTLLFS